MGEFFVFTLGGERYAVPLTVVREVRDPTTVMPVPGVAPFVRGVTNLRGTVLAIVDLRMAFGVATGPGTPPSGAREVVLHYAGVDVGIVADAITGVVEGTVEAPPDGLSEELRNSCAGTLRADDVPAAVLDPAFVHRLRDRLRTTA